jgi:aerobic-type carbon monoxide dehydrogenase small subunit (CoxS/CutS family)
MIMAATQLIDRNSYPTRENIRHGLEGNLCRCTGYQHIVEAVEYAARETVLRETDQIVNEMKPDGDISWPRT